MSILSQLKQCTDVPDLWRDHCFCGGGLRDFSGEAYPPVSTRNGYHKMEANHHLQSDLFPAAQWGILVGVIALSGSLGTPGRGFDCP